MGRKQMKPSPNSNSKAKSNSKVKSKPPPRIELEGKLFRKDEINPNQEWLKNQLNQRSNHQVKSIVKRVIRSIQEFDEWYPNDSEIVPEEVKLSVILYQTSQLFQAQEFDNQADFHFAPIISKLLAKSYTAKKNSFLSSSDTTSTTKVNIIVAGLNLGLLLGELIKCLEVSTFSASGFEIDSINFRIANQSFANNPHVSLYLKGVSNTSSILAIGGGGQIAGIYNEEEVAKHMKSIHWPRRRKSNKINMEIETTTLIEFVKEKKMKKVHYLTIDVEGHETCVLQGMQLDSPANQKMFSMFQMELGGTWVVEDPRHPVGSWTQYETMVYLEKLGYKLYLIGMRVLLPVTSLFFKYGPMEGDKNAIQGNVFVIHREYADPIVMDYVKKFDNPSFIRYRFATMKYPRNQSPPKCEALDNL